MLFSPLFILSLIDADVTKSFSGAFTPESLGMTFADLQANVANATQNALLKAAVRNAIYAMPAYFASVTGMSVITL
jgi:hypothetical protein